MTGLARGYLKAAQASKRSRTARWFAQSTASCAWAAWRGSAWRQWIYATEGDALVIRYPATNAELHTFRFAEDGSAAHVHFCDRDRYSALLQRLPGGDVSISYDVTGPAKDYRLRTLLTRA
jgi:hypothetical protein